MPGVHTFYDGSTILQPLAKKIGIDCDKVNFVLCLFASMPIAFCYQKFLPPGKTTRQVRALVPLLVGLLFSFFCFGRAVKHLLCNSLISYGLIYLVPTKHVHIVVFCFTMGYLLWIHFYRWLILTSYSLDITGPMMVAVQKITTLAFSLHDGCARKPEKLTELQKNEAITEIPSLIDYMSYIFNFQTTMTGPVNFYADYAAFLTGESGVDKDDKSNISISLRKFALAVFYLLVVAFIAEKYPPMIILTEEYLALPIYQWVFWWYFTILLFRTQYYYAWTFSDAMCNMSGFGYSGKDADGNSRWELCTNVYPLRVENAQSLKEILDNWNVQTGGWLRRVAYDRAPKSVRTFATYLLSAVWHGVSVGYYMTFITGALFTPAAATFRRCIRWRFLDDPNKKFAYDVFSSFAAKISLTYLAFPFVAMNFQPAMTIYIRVFFIGHIIAFGIYFLLPQYYPPLNGSTTSSTTTPRTSSAVSSTIKTANGVSSKKELSQKRELSSQKDITTAREPSMKKEL